MYDPEAGGMAITYSCHQRHQKQQLHKVSKENTDFLEYVCLWSQFRKFLLMIFVDSTI